MPSPIMIHVDYSGEFTVVFTQDGSPVDLSGATSITMEVFDTPGTVTGSFNTVSESANFDTAGLADGELTFKWTSSTFDNSTYLGTGVTAQHSLRFAVITSDWASPGRVIPNYLVAVFSE